MCSSLEACPDVGHERHRPHAVHDCLRKRDTQALSAADATTAKEALAIAEALLGHRGEIKYITSPQEGEFGVEMLRVLAKEEGEEIPIAPAEPTNQGWKLFDKRPNVSKLA